MRRFGTMSEKVGLAGNIDMPMRQASTSSARSDDAVPTTDPSDVSSSSPFPRRRKLIVVAGGFPLS